MIGRVNTDGGGKGAALTVTAPAGSTVTVSKDGKTLTRVAGDDGVVVFRGLETGTWTLSITDGEQTASKTVEIVTDYATEISYNVIPEFTYTGDYEIVNDADEPITVSQDNWKIRLLTSGTLTFQALNGAENGIDVFLVGGGGSTTESRFEGGSIDHRGGGGGGYTTTKKGVPVNTSTSYDIVVGAGAGEGAGDGGTSTAFGQSAAGGSGTITERYGGGAGGSGGGGRANVNTTGYTTVGKGGSDGGDGYPESGPRQNGGKGQGTTTREFGEAGRKIYAGGGGGSTYSQWTPSATPGGYGGEGGGGRGGNSNCNPTPGGANTGGGGGGGVKTCASGGSGIVVIRNKR